MYGVERMKEKRKEVAELQSVQAEEMGVYVRDVGTFDRLLDGRSKKRKKARGK